MGLKLCWVVNGRGEIVSWSWDTANVHDQVFLPLVEALEGRSIVLADVGFNAAEGVPANLKLCPRGAWNDRLLAEKGLSPDSSPLRRAPGLSRGHVQRRVDPESNATS